MDYGKVMTGYDLKLRKMKLYFFNIRIIIIQYKYTAQVRQEDFVFHYIIIQQSCRAQIIISSCKRGR